MIGLVANGAAVLIGTLLGVIGRLSAGPCRAALMRLTDLMMAFPALLLAIALAAILGPRLWIVALVIALVNWVQIARIVYTETSGARRTATISRRRGRWAPARPRILLQHPARI